MSGQHFFKIFQTIGSSLNVKHMALVQEPIQDGRCHDLIPCQGLGPVLHGFIGRDNGASTAVAVIDDTEQKSRFFSGKGLEAHFINDQKGGFQIFDPLHALLSTMGHPLQPWDIHFVAFDFLFFKLNQYSPIPSLTLKGLFFLSVSSGFTLSYGQVPGG